MGMHLSLNTKHFFVHLCSSRIKSKVAEQEKLSNFVRCTQLLQRKQQSDDFTKKRHNLKENLKRSERLTSVCSEKLGFGCKMRDRNILPFLGERMNNYKKSSLRIKILDSIPENDVGTSTQMKSLPSFCGNMNVIERKKAESKHDMAEKGHNSLPNDINLPKLENKSTTASGFEQEIPGSPNSSSFLNIANMRLSPRENTEKPKREAGINSANYLIYEPSVGDQVTANIDLSRYAFRSSLERIPETERERLSSAQSKRKSNSADGEKKDLTTTEKKISKKKEARAGNVNNVDLFDQQRQQLARKGPPTRVLFSCKLKKSRPGTPDSFNKSQEMNEDFPFPRIVLYQWEVHEQPKIIKTLRSRKFPKRLPVLHRIPTAPQGNQPIDKDGDDSGDENVRRPESPLSKIPHPPPPTPRCQRCPSRSSENVTE